MFFGGKKEKKVATKNQGVQKTGGYEVLISKDTVITGNISIKGRSRIDGTINGTLAVESDLFIGETGQINATIYVESAYIAGKVNGNIICKGCLELAESADIVGDIRCKTIVSNAGAKIRGNIAEIEIPAEEIVPELESSVQ